MQGRAFKDAIADCAWTSPFGELAGGHHANINFRSIMFSNISMIKPCCCAVPSGFLRFLSESEVGRASRRFQCGCCRRLVFLPLREFTFSSRNQATNWKAIRPACIDNFACWEPCSCAELLFVSSVRLGTPQFLKLCCDGWIRGVVLLSAEVSRYLFGSGRGNYRVGSL